MKNARVCVYGERKRETKRECNTKCSAQQREMITVILLVSCVTSKKEKKILQQKMQQGQAGRLPLTRALKDFISYIPLLVLRKRVFWASGTSGRVTASQSSKGMNRLYFQGYESVNLLIPLNGKAVYFFETSEINYPTIWCDSPEDLVTQQARSGNHKSLFLVVRMYLFLFILSPSFICLVDARVNFWGGEQVFVIFGRQSVFMNT